MMLIDPKGTPISGHRNRDPTRVAASLWKREYHPRYATLLGKYKGAFRITPPVRSAARRAPASGRVAIIGVPSCGQKAWDRHGFATTCTDWVRLASTS
jgi:hypothetical protein